MNTNPEKRTLPWQRINRIESFSISLPRACNLASILTWKTYETGEEFHVNTLQLNPNSLNYATIDRAGVDTDLSNELVHASVATLDNELIALWSWKIAPLAATSNAHGTSGLDLTQLRSDPRLGRYFNGNERWLFGGSLMERRGSLTEKWIEFGRINPVLEHGVAGAIVVVEDTHTTSPHSYLPRPNYLQNVGYGVIEDPRVTPYLRCGFIISSLHDTDRVLLVAPVSRVARRHSF